MVIKRRKGYIAVYGETWALKFARIASGHQDCVVAAFAPFVFMKTPEYEWPYLMRHELIHFKQYYETLFIGMILLKIIENSYLRYIKGLSKREAYLAFSMEQEAYLNHSDESYLYNRKPYAFLKYIFNKKKIEFIRGPKGEVVVLE